MSTSLIALRHRGAAAVQQSRLLADELRLMRQAQLRDHQNEISNMMERQCIREDRESRLGLPATPPEIVTYPPATSRQT